MGRTEPENAAYSPYPLQSIADETATDARKTPSIYVVGEEDKIAKLWVNGVAADIPDSGLNAAFYSVFVCKDDIYIAGHVTKHGIEVATVWKNGVAAELTDGTREANARSIFVHNGDVYAAGREGKRAKVWKNGVATDLTDDSDYKPYAYSVFVYNDDVYVAGKDGNRALVWKNGVATELSGGYGHGENCATSVFVYKGDVYVSGYLNTRIMSHEGVAVVWKNGVAAMLDDNSIANAVYVYRGDVYAAGTTFKYFYGYNAVVWKNGVATRLSFNEAFAASVFVYDGDVYVVGYKEDIEDRFLNSEVAKLWINRETTDLSPEQKYAKAVSVFVTG
ncbi:MAG: hypothetical protein LBT74_01390 [Acidobacteriota bacterium]|jgi:sulfur transfer complex TusBCD TusB component (DsrH family)|nr:hypothetical protein [Acidobacteriota bacterium]